MKTALNLPNKITLARLVLSIVFFILLVQYSHRGRLADGRGAWTLDVAFVVFVVAAGTDFIDGYLARKRGLVTPLGRVLDPFVDKVLICGAFILFTGTGFIDAQGRNVTHVEAWMVAVIIARELLVTGLRGFHESAGKAFGATLPGKAKMWVQCIACGGILLILAHEGTWFSAAVAGGLKTALVWTTVVVTTVSALDYLNRSRDALWGRTAP